MLDEPWRSDRAVGHPVRLLGGRRAGVAVYVRAGRCSRVSALRRGGSTRAWRKLRASILDRDGWRCHWCGAVATTVDHVVPRAAGGDDSPGNLVASCSRCNCSRGARMGRSSEGGPSRGW
ncbi:HNH endonuclease [Catenulispora pinisilvae]|uniref:HNH endonuclease n=1 Tax=Catenulispora pinisilvae TaxID=2705253 RepID=UPI0018926F1C